MNTEQRIKEIEDLTLEVREKCVHGEDIRRNILQVTTFIRTLLLEEGESPRLDNMLKVTKYKIRLALFAPELSNVDLNRVIY
jgi:hypothetical protein